MVIRCLCTFIIVCMASAASAQTIQPSPSSPVHVIGHSVDYAYLLPVRPKNPKELHIAVGVYNDYGMVRTEVTSMLLELEDPGTHARTQYFLAEDTTLNGRPLVCEPEVAVGAFRLCGAMPNEFVAGKTYIGLIYWDSPFELFPDDRGTDTLVTCASPDQCVSRLSSQIVNP